MILLYNNEWGNKEQFAGYKPPRHYSCIYDPNDPNGVSETIDIYHNFSHKPDFAYPYSTDPNVFINIHLAYDSFCRDKGSPNLPYADQNDIDAEYRVADDYVDVGADEISCSNVYNAYDWNADGIVNYGDFNRFAQNWLAHDPNDPALLDPNDPMYEEYHDPNSPYYISPERQEQWHTEGYQWNFVSTSDSMYSIDVADLLFMLDDSPWLWVACWRHDIQEMQQQTQQFMMMSSSSFIAEPTTTLQIETEVKQPAEPVLTPAKTVPVQAIEAEPVAVEEELNPAVEQANILSLIEDIDGLINAGGDDAEAWQEIKNLLEQALVDTEDAANDPNEF